MRVLFDISHPAHVHFFKNVIWALEADGHETCVVARDKDVTHALLDTLGIPYLTHGRSSERGMLGQAGELLGRDRFLLETARRFRPDIICTRNPAGVQVARLTRRLGIFDTDDGRRAGLHYRAAAPFAHIITCPASMHEEFGRKQRTYPGYKALAFLHPNHFQPDPSILDLLGVEQDEPYSIVRLVAMHAVHDTGVHGIPMATKRELFDLLSSRGRVFLTTEEHDAPEFAEHQLRIPPHRFHDALAFASVVVGDSASVAAEAAILGTPAVYSGTLARRVEYLNDMERRYQLVRSFQNDELPKILDVVDRITCGAEGTDVWRERKDRLLADSVDVSAWYVELLNELGQGSASGALH